MCQIGVIFKEFKFTKTLLKPLEGEFLQHLDLFDVLEDALIQPPTVLQV